MTDRNTHDPNEQRAADHVRGLPHAEAAGAFRDRLRHAFVTGTIEPSAPPSARPAPATSRRWWWSWLIPATVVAAAVVIIVNRPVPLRVTAVNGSGGVVVGERVVRSSTDLVGRNIPAGSRLDVSDSTTIDLLASDVVLIEVTPGSRMTVPKAPGRLFSRAAACSLLAGEIRVKTGSRFHGVSLRVYTPDGMAEITGTLLSVQSDDNGTCVCVLEGTAHVGVTEADLQPVQPGYRKVMPRGGSPSIVAIAPPHRDGMVDFDRRVGDRISRRK